VVHIENKESGEFAHKETTLYEKRERFNNEEVGVEKGEEAYLHLKNNHDEIELFESSMPQTAKPPGQQQENKEEEKNEEKEDDSTPTNANQDHTDHTTFHDNPQHPSYEPEEDFDWRDMKFKTDPPPPQLKVEEEDLENSKNPDLNMADID